MTPKFMSHMLFIWDSHVCHSAQSCCISEPVEKFILIVETSHLIKITVHVEIHFHF